MTRAITPFLLLLHLSPISSAELLPGIDPNPPEGAPIEGLPSVKVAGSDESGTGEILCDRLREILLESPQGGDFCELNPGIRASGDLLLPSPVTLGSKLGQWIGQPLTQGDLVTIADSILIHYDVEGYPVVGIDAPEQDLSTGTLRVSVHIGRVGRVGVKRPKYGNPKAITRGLKVREGEILHRSEVNEQLSWYGRTVFRKPQLLVSPGFEPDTADLLIALAEKKPWSAYIGYENTGAASVGEDRFVLGFAGMTPNEHVIAFQTLTGVPVSSLQAYAIGWQIPFHKLHQTLQLDAAYAEVLTNSMSSGLPVENTGTSWSTAATQAFFLPSLGGWNQRLAAGFEVKGTNQFVLFGGSSFSPGEVRLVNGKINYGVSRDWDNGACALDTSMLLAPGNLIAGNQDADFEVYDPEATSNYLIWRMAGEGWWSPGGDWRLALRGAAQLADSRLLPAEQMAAGGYQTVRGIPEREYFADEGWFASFEIYSPSIVIRNIYQMRFLTFWDQSTLKSLGETADYYSGAGIGVRISVTEHLDLRLDQGWRLDDSGSQTHFGLRVSF